MFEEKIKNFINMQKLKEFSTAKPAVQVMLKEISKQNATIRNMKSIKENLTGMGKIW